MGVLKLLTASVKTLIKAVCIQTVSGTTTVCVHYRAAVCVAQCNLRSLQQMVCANETCCHRQTWCPTDLQSLHHLSKVLGVVVDGAQ